MIIFAVRIFKHAHWHTTHHYAIREEAELFGSMLEDEWDIKEMTLEKVNAINEKAKS